MLTLVVFYDPESGKKAVPSNNVTIIQGDIQILLFVSDVKIIKPFLN